MTTAAESLRPAGITDRRTGLRPPQWPTPAWGSIVLVLLFIATSCWWLSENRGIPVYDAGFHLSDAIDAYEALISGRLLAAYTSAAPYPPLGHLVGALGILIAGVGVVAPIVASNVVFVPLLALGCYKVGRLAFGPLTGMLAVAFALGSPLIVEEFHELMLDAPEAAMVAISVWAILDTQRFSRVGVSALAGLAVGLGMLTKETFVFFVAGVVLVTVLRGGYRAWRGIAVFAAVALVVAAPWYLYEYTAVHTLAGDAFGSSRAEAMSIAPPRLSSTNLEWYFWSFINQQLFVPLFALSVIGVAWTLAGSIRRKPVSGYAAELLIGAFVSWAALTETFVHDPRYAIPLTLYFAVFGVAWITALPRLARAPMIAVVGLIALANLLGVGFGLGRTVLSGPITESYNQPGRATFFATNGLWLGAPIREGNTLGLLRALRREGVQEIRWTSPQETEIEFSIPGITALARVAGLSIAGESLAPEKASRRYAFLLHALPEPSLPRPCTTLQNGQGVWVRLGGARGTHALDYCPLRTSHST
jgi:4-amino-4-deoxy-L-arabinose transferase-like glycosyltransferase